jgi:lauroyl/myristoyl acyltransferase
MTISDSTTQTLGTASILALSQGLPPFIGHPVAALVAYFLGNRVLSPTFRAIMVNQWVANDCKFHARELRQAIRRVYQQQGRSLYDFYHNLDRPTEISRLAEISDKFRTLIEACKSGRRKKGTLLLMPHLAGFNVSGFRLVQLGFKFLTLAVPNPNRGYLWQNQLRNERGMEVLPMNMEALQLARQRLQSGGVVLTGVDRPHHESVYAPKFFGRPAALPVAYVKLALKTDAEVVLVNFHTQKNGISTADVSDPLTLERLPDPHEELVVNAENILKVIEGFIRADPTQWMMFLPVWPDVEIEVPRI